MVWEHEKGLIKSIESFNVTIDQQLFDVIYRDSFLRDIFGFIGKERNQKLFYKMEFFGSGEIELIAGVLKNIQLV